MGVTVKILSLTYCFYLSMRSIRCSASEEIICEIDVSSVAVRPTGGGCCSLLSSTSFSSFRPYHTWGGLSIDLRKPVEIRNTHKSIKATIIGDFIICEDMCPSACVRQENYLVAERLCSHTFGQGQPRVRVPCAVAQGL